MIKLLKYRPYLIITCLCYILFSSTLIIDTRDFADIGIELSEGAIVHNHKTNLQEFVLYTLLTLLLIIISFLPIVRRNFPNPGRKIINNLVTIISVYFGAYLIFLIFDNPNIGFTIFNYWHKIPAIDSAFFTLIISSIGILIIKYFISLYKSYVEFRRNTTKV